jgi:DNA-binding GntR family transcriptional regulator
MSNLSSAASLEVAAGLRPIDRSALWDRAYEALREELLAGRFMPGQRLPLRDLAARFGISLTPVRDAVNRLVAERVLERGSSGQGGGAAVPMMDGRLFGELCVIRQDLEGRAAATAAERAGPTDTEELAVLLEEMRRLIAQGRFADYLALHRRFHFRLYGVAEMPILAGMIDNLWLRCGPVLNYVIPNYVVSLKGTDLHEAALVALVRRDGCAAAHAIRQDIAEAGRYIVSLADGTGVIRPPS